MRFALLFALMSTAMLSFQVTAADSIKFKDLAVTKIMKAPGGFGSFETANKFGSSMTAKIEAPGITAKSFTKASVFTIEFFEGSSSGSGDKLVDFKLGDDPKYVDGASSVKLQKSAFQGIKQSVILTATLKITDGLISLTYTSKILPLYAQQFINYGSIPGGVKFPEGKSTATRACSCTVTVGTFVKKIPGLTYNANMNNKKAKDSNLWTGATTGTIIVP